MNNSISAGQGLRRSANQFAIEILLLANRLWQWWLGEIRAMMPKDLAPPIVELIGEDIHLVEGGRRLAETETIRGRVILRIPPRQVLRRTLQLPMQARLGLRRILANDLERQSPIDPRNVRFTYRLLAMDRATGRLTVSLVMLRRDETEAAMARLNARGIQVKAIRACNAPDLPNDDFPNLQARNFKLRRRELLTTLLLIWCLGAAAADLALRLHQAETQIARLEAQAATLAPAAMQAGNLRQEITAQQQSVNFLITLRTQPSMGAILAEITQRLPDGTWLYSLNDDGREIEMQGYSTHASTLVADFDASHLFANANFRAAMTQGPNPGLQQFDLAMTLETNK